MRKSVSYFCCGVLLSFLMAVGCPLRAQVSNPSAWESFVSSKDNPVVSDTFRLQTFGKSDRDNWIYQADKNVLPPGNEHTLRIPVGSRVAFTPFRLSLYEKVEICTYLRGEHLTREQTLQYQTFRNNQSQTLTVPLDTLYKYGWQFNYKRRFPPRFCLCDGQHSCLFPLYRFRRLERHCSLVTSSAAPQSLRFDSGRNDRQP